MKTITLRTKPVPINQKYGIMNGRNLLTRKYRDAKEALQWEAQTQWNGQPLEDDLIVHVQFYFGDRRRRDIDAYLKILLDAMEGVVYQDDAQVMELHVFKHVDTNDPKTVVQVL